MGKEETELGWKGLSDFRIREAAEEDVALILQFIKKLAHYERLSHEVSATEQILRENLFGERKVAEIILAEYQNRPVGFALYFHNFSTFLGKPGIYIEDLFVDENYRGRGFGYALFVYIVRLARQRDCGRIEWAVLDWNTPAIKFYQDLGAVPMNDWITYRLTGEALRKLAGTSKNASITS
ncbi:MAG: GNAT family N-acetyltransferase [Deltaproteobacteria bacterium]|nr:MAG: GNAT family N-acetyltransferase [Deltaproteobacteria bacterium]